ncbi:hypothetical protein P3H15_28215 [Rhodococcus sp. T2V]|uniref:hypothetical protein n=1 Tax=Rhodococcus sp. T2V TaxID=3034164 RepID=UPI0023E152E4|nr:hypothetical protein [Rhodococcus sp. T2V]MDF3308904.1 hypothetical protein [Rhodococcus sp. T2V]
MTDPVQAFLQAASLELAAFPPGSRYQGIPIGRWTAADGRTVVFVRRRTVPPPDRFVTLRLHTVVEGDRLDNLAATHLGDPQQYWRLCDANGAMRPDELIDTIGRALRITLPEGMPGATDA